MPQFQGTVDQIEKNTNKVTAISGNETSYQYPTVTAVKNYIIDFFAGRPTIWVKASEEEMLETPAKIGDICVRTDLSNARYMLKEYPESTLANWILLPTPTDVVDSVNSKTGAVTLDYADVGAVSISITINGKPLTDDITIVPEDIGAEESNWSPTLNSWDQSWTGTFSVEQANYYRFGNLTYASCVLKITSVGTVSGSGNLVLGGLPYHSKYDAFGVFQFNSDRGFQGSEKGGTTECSVGTEYVTFDGINYGDLQENWYLGINITYINSGV